MSKQYWITKPRYLKQDGEDQAHYVQASPDDPTLVTMPDDCVADRGMRPVTEAAPEPPAPPKTGFNKKQPKPKKAEPKKAGTQRASDR